MILSRQFQRHLHTRGISRKEPRRGTNGTGIFFPAIVPRTDNRTVTRNGRDGDGDETIVDLKPTEIEFLKLDQL